MANPTAIPTNLPPGFTAPAGSIINQGQANYTNPANATPSATTPITSASLQPASPIQYTSPATPPIPDISNLGSNVDSNGNATLTAGEQQASDLSQRLEDLNNQLVGKSAYTQQQNDAAGVTALQAQQNDLSAQLSQLKNQASAIPIQLQTDSQGRGITEGGLAPIQAGMLRNNAVQALGISSMIDASNGLLATAQAKAAQAVAAKYDPIQEQINAATANLNTILNDPATTVAEANRAQAQLAIQQQKADQVAKAKQDASDVLTAAQAAAKNGADAQTLQAMQQAPNGAAALAIAVQNGYGTGDVHTLMTSHPDAGILPTDTVEQANAKIIASPSYTLAQKSAILDNNLKTAQIGKLYADAATTASDKSQQGLEKQYAATLLKEVSNRSGGLGLQDAKVNQAIHLQSLLDQNSTIDAQGNVHYNITPQNYNELAMGLASLVSGTNSVSDSARAEINAKTAKGDIAGAIQYITGEPQKGNTDQIISNLAASIARQGEVAQQERQTYIDFLHGLAPTDLDPDRQAALETQTLNQFNPVSQTQAVAAINKYVANNPKMLDKVIAAHSVPGVTDQDILEYIKNPANGFDNYGDLP